MVLPAGALRPGKAVWRGSLAEDRPDLALQWVPEGNGDVTPESVPAGSLRSDVRIYIRMDVWLHTSLAIMGRIHDAPGGLCCTDTLAKAAVVPKRPTEPCPSGVAREL